MNEARKNSTWVKTKRKLQYVLQLFFCKLHILVKSLNVNCQDPLTKKCMKNWMQKGINNILTPPFNQTSTNPKNRRSIRNFRKFKVPKIAGEYIFCNFCKQAFGLKIAIGLEKPSTKLFWYFWQWFMVLKIAVID